MDYKEWAKGMGKVPPPPPRTDTGPRGSNRLFHTFKQWLKNDIFHRQGKYCEDDGCGTCSEWRRIELEKRGEDFFSRYEAAKTYFSNKGMDVEKFLAETDVEDLLDTEKRDTPNDVRQRAGLSLLQATEASLSTVLAIEKAYEEVRRVKEQEKRWNELQDAGFDYGRAIANDALIALTQAPPPKTASHSKEQAVFTDALLQGFETTLCRNLPNSEEDNG